MLLDIYFVFVNKLVDINECQKSPDEWTNSPGWPGEEHNGGCQHNCSNVDGGYYCYCLPGFELTKDGLHCGTLMEKLIRIDR